MQTSSNINNLNTPSFDASLVKPNEKFVDELSKFVEGLLDLKGIVFSCEDIELTTNEVSSKDGLLPVLLYVSSQTIEQIWGPQNLVFRVDQDALCGMVPELNKKILPPSVWLHVMSYEIENIASLNPDGPAIIDDWFKMWSDAISKKKIAVLAPLQKGIQQNNT